MTKADLIEEVSRLAELTRKDSEVIVDTIFDSVVRSLRVGDKIEIRGFGSFPRAACAGPQPEDRRPRGSPGEEDSVLQAEQGIEGPGQQQRGSERGSRSAGIFRTACVLDARRTLDWPRKYGSGSFRLVSGHRCSDAEPLIDGRLGAGRKLRSRLDGRGRPSLPPGQNQTGP